MLTLCLATYLNETSKPAFESNVYTIILLKRGLSLITREEQREALPYGGGHIKFPALENNALCNAHAAADRMIQGFFPNLVYRWL